MLVPISDNEKFVFDTTENSSEIDGFIFTLKCIVRLFDEYFPQNGSRSLIVTLNHSDDSPICYKQAGIILLNTDSPYWIQAAYQFSHELCHYMIPDDVCEKLRWFEESILEIDCYQREKNRYIAKLLLPIFKKNPPLWHAVPYLCKIPDNQSFLDSLAVWKSISPAESQSGLREILQLFR